MIKQLHKLKNRENIVICNKCKSVLLYTDETIQNRKIMDWKGKVVNEEKYIPCLHCESSITVK